MNTKKLMRWVGACAPFGSITSVVMLLLLLAVFKAKGADAVTVYNRTGDCLRFNTYEEYLICGESEVCGYYGGEGIYMRNNIDGAELWIEPGAFSGSEITVFYDDTGFYWVEGNAVRRGEIVTTKKSDKKVRRK